jgi:SAM-dependent methyltransferase
MILDLGCGSYCRGDIGIDVSFNAPGTAHLDRYIGYSANPGPTLIRSDLNFGIPLGNNSVDTVLVIHCLEHLFSPYLFLTECRRVLRDNGKLVIVVPNPVTNDADWKDRTHIYSFTEASLRNLVGMFFEIEKCILIAYNLDIMLVGRKKLSAKEA